MASLSRVEGDVASASATTSASAAGFAVGWNATNVGPAAGSLATAYGTPVTTIGFIITAIFVAHAAFQLPAGRLVDRIGARQTAMLGLLLMSAGGLVALAVPAVSVGLVGRLITGSGVAFTFIGAVEYARTAGGTQSQGVFGSLNLAGASVALALTPLAESATGWRAPYHTALAVTLLALVLIWTAPNAPVAYASPTQDAGSVARDRLLYRIAVLHVASFGLGLVVANWTVVLLVSTTDLSASQAGPIGALTLLGGVATRPLGGWILQRRPLLTSRAVAASMVLGAVATCVLAAGGPTWTLVAAALSVGLASGLPFAPAFAAASRHRQDQPGSAVALVNLSATVTALALTPVVGLTMTLPGDGRIGFGLLGALWLAALLALPGFDESRRRDLHPRPSLGEPLHAPEKRSARPTKTFVSSAR